MDPLDVAGANTDNNCNGFGYNEERECAGMDEREDTTIYKVVVNHEDQYSIWPAHRENALGWRDAGKTGTKAECLAYIKEVWTDMRPLSLRKKMEEASSQGPDKR
ncbi:MAG TPA: MbtH family protein [Bryobacteraceae bacterium]